MANESALWKWLNEFHHPRVQMDRIENSLGRSIPDVEGQIMASHFHLELKCLHGQAGLKSLAKGKIDYAEETGILKFQIGQREWAYKRWQIGGIAYILIEGFRGDLYLIPGAYAISLKRIGPVKTALLYDLAVWSCQKNKNPEDRIDLFATLIEAEAQRQKVEDRLQRDPLLRSASQPTSELARELDSLPAV